MTFQITPLLRCRFRVPLGDRGFYLCRHPAVRTRGGVVTQSVCAGCELGSASSAASPPYGDILRRLVDAATRDRDGRLRVGFVTPNLVLGGAERWVLNMLRYLDGERISLSGVCLLSAAPADLEMCLEASQFAPVFGGPVARSGDRPEQGAEDRPEQQVVARPVDQPQQGDPPEHGAVASSPPHLVALSSPLGHRHGSAPATGARSGDRLEQDSPPVIRLGSVREALAALCQRSDVIVAWGSAHFARLMAEQRFAGQVVVVAHGSAPSTVEMLASSQHAAHQLVGVSRASAAAFCNPRASVIHNGADAERCAVTVPREETRRAWGAAAGEILVGYVGRFSWEKNPLAAAVAVRELNWGAQRRTAEGGYATFASTAEGGCATFRAVHVGGGAQEEDVKAKVRQIAPESIFVTPVEQIGDALAALDVFVSAAPSEGFSLALTEAWLCGVPTVATRVGAVPELEELHGQMVVPVSVGAGQAELATAVRRALSAENRPVVERAKQVAWRHYTAEAMGQRWTEFLVNVGRALQIDGSASVGNGLRAVP